MLHPVWPPERYLPRTWSVKSLFDTQFPLCSLAHPFFHSMTTGTHVAPSGLSHGVTESRNPPREFLFTHTCTYSHTPTCTHAHGHTRTNTHTYVHKHSGTFSHMHGHTLTHTLPHFDTTHVHGHTRTNTHTHTPNSDTSSHARTHTYVHTLPHFGTSSHTLPHALTHILVHTRTYNVRTHTRTCSHTYSHMHVLTYTRTYIPTLEGVGSHGRSRVGTRLVSESSRRSRVGDCEVDSVRRWK